MTFEGMYLETAAPSQRWKRNYFTAGADPTVDDDETESYYLGSEWINLTSGEAFVCVDQTPGAAVWKSTTAGASGGGRTFTFFGA